MDKVWVELGELGDARRIFKSKKAAVKAQVDGTLRPVVLMPYAIAIGQIRRIVFELCERMCVKCGQVLIYERGSWNSMEMDERQARGKIVQKDGEYLSGEISVENCQSLCRTCHTGPGGKHDRRPQFSSAGI